VGKINDVKEIEKGNMMHDQKFARKDVQIIFPKNLKLRKYFWYFL